MEKAGREIEEETDSGDVKRWINTALSQISRMDNNQGSRILENCGRECAKSHNLSADAEKIRNGVEDQNDLDLLFDEYKDKIYHHSPRLYKKGKTIYLAYHQCGCPLVADDNVDDPFFCHCTTGYTKERFETLFDRPVQVVLKSSILRGDKICLQIISIE
ncbi:MAG: hypothetical protein HKM93_23600 [Desulfobacteraceae bacterium]|nr:hypothetical protein [Desulfobacteraceae bacterium]